MLITTDGQVFKDDAQGRNSAKNHVRGKKDVKVEEFKKGALSGKSLKEKDIVKADLPTETQTLISQATAKLEEQVELLTKEKEALNTENTDLREENVKLALSVDSLTTQLDKVVDEMEKLAEEKASLTQANHQLISTNAILAKENETLKKPKTTKTTNSPKPAATKVGKGDSKTTKKNQA